jgi:hypothetical protein
MDRNQDRRQLRGPIQLIIGIDQGDGIDEAHGHCSLGKDAVFVDP